MPEIDDLYSLPLDDFTEARDALASELRSAGRKEEAAEVKKLRKPSLAAWAVNQLAREKSEAMEELFELRDRIENSTSATDMRAASEDRRKLIAELVDRAGSILTVAGRATGANTMQAITQTLHAGDTEDERDALLHGRLSRELSPSGFGSFSTAFESAAGDEADGASDPRMEEKRRRAEELAEEAEDAEAEAERLAEELGTAERALQRAQARSDMARRSAEEAGKNAERAKAEVDRAGD